MTDNYRDEMREALADAIDWIECIGKELREIADYERSQLCPEAADEYERQAREGADLVAALSRLSAQDEPAGDAREFVRDWIVANHGVLSMAGTAAQDLIVRLQARLSASEQSQ